MKKVFLFSGKINSGKNQLADFVGEIYKKRKKKVISDLFASDLKQWSSDDFVGLGKILNGISHSLEVAIGQVKTNREAYGLPDDGLIPKLISLAHQLKIKEENFYENKTDISRNLLQTYGTNIFRNRVDDDFWIKRTKKRIIEHDADIILITDVRFPNEIDFIANSDEYETYSIRINRQLDRSGDEHEHISETALDDYEEFVYSIDNNAGLKELEDNANALVESIEGELPTVLSEEE